MLIGLFADLHGNREALSACLAHAKDCGVGRYVFLGDYVGYGADPGWVVDKVISYVQRGAVALLGNHDRAVFSDSEQMNPSAQAAIEWTRKQLDNRQCEFLRALPLIIEEERRLFVHASANGPLNWHYVLDAHAASKSLMATACAQTFCGHVHVPAMYHLSSVGKVGHFIPTAGVNVPLSVRLKWLAVIGSVGQPRDHNPAACYALLDDTANLLTYVRIPYDVETAARKVRDAGLPLVLGIRLERGY
jgi:diadenosine tetraphosphatase ApaH/serine/threonine PP2A family protein phosphatase